MTLGMGPDWDGGTWYAQEAKRSADFEYLEIPDDECEGCGEPKDECICEPCRICGYLPCGCDYLYDQWCDSQY